MAVCAASAPMLMAKLSPKPAMIGTISDNTITLFRKILVTTSDITKLSDIPDTIYPMTDRIMNNNGIRFDLSFFNILLLFCFFKHCK